MRAAQSVGLIYFLTKGGRGSLGRFDSLKTCEAGGSGRRCCIGYLRSCSNRYERSAGHTKGLRTADPSKTEARIPPPKGTARPNRGAVNQRGGPQRVLENARCRPLNWATFTYPRRDFHRRRRMGTRPCRPNPPYFGWIAAGHEVNQRAETVRRRFLAPQVGLEPTTLRLTAECSTIELLRSKARDFSSLLIRPKGTKPVNFWRLPGQRIRTTGAAVCQADSQLGFFLENPVKIGAKAVVCAADSRGNGRKSRSEPGQAGIGDQAGESAAAGASGARMRVGSLESEERCCRATSRELIGWRRKIFEWQ